MAENDPSNELLIDWSTTGEDTLKARSRLMSAANRLVGAGLDFLGPSVEKRIRRQRAIIEGEHKLISAISKAGVLRVGVDEGFAKRALETHFRDFFRGQDNREAVIAGAIEDLKRRPPSVEQLNSGSDTLSEEFVGRFKGYAEAASTEQLREKWSRVLASEVRAPGTLSSKTMRLIDEIDQPVALLFEAMCRSRLGRAIPMCLLPETDAREKAILAASGLLVDVENGHTHTFGSGTRGSTKFFSLGFDRYGVAFDDRDDIPYGNSGTDTPIFRSGPEKPPALQILLLSADGFAVANAFLEDCQKQAAMRLAEVIHSFAPNANTWAVEASPQRMQFHRFWQPPSVPV